MSDLTPARRRQLDTAAALRAMPAETRPCCLCGRRTADRGADGFTPFCAAHVPPACGVCDGEGCEFCPAAGPAADASPAGEWFGFIRESNRSYSPAQALELARRMATVSTLPAALRRYGAADLVKLLNPAR